jgi:hypothetical protein
MLQQAEPKLQLTVTETGKKSHSPTFQFIKRERDVVYSAEIAGQQMNLVICGLEHQTKIDYSMPLRTATLDLLEYLRQCRLIADWHEQAKVFVVKYNYPKLQSKNGHYCMSILDKVASIGQ